MFLEVGVVFDVYVTDSTFVFSGGLFVNWADIFVGQILCDGEDKPLAKAQTRIESEAHHFTGATP